MANMVQKTINILQALQMNADTVRRLHPGSDVGISIIIPEWNSDTRIALVAAGFTLREYSKWDSYNRNDVQVKLVKS